MDNKRLIRLCAVYFEDKPALLSGSGNSKKLYDHIHRSGFEEFGTLIKISCASCGVIEIT